MSVTAELLGLLSYEMAIAILDELNRQNPGTGARVLESVRSAVTEEAKGNAYGNNAEILEALATLKY